MKKKKILVLFLMVFFITGCTADYELTFEDGVFSEHIVIREEKSTNANDFVGINSLKDNPKLVEIDKNNSYKYSYSDDEKDNVLTLDFVYDELSLDKSLIYNNCFRYRSYIDGDDYYYIKMEGDMVCEYLSSVDITFKTDKVVLMENATYKDKEKGIYKWENFSGGEIIIQVSKVDSINSNVNAKAKELIPWYIKVVIASIVVVAAIVAYKMIKRDSVN